MSLEDIHKEIGLRIELFRKAAELTSLRQRVEALENVKRLAEKLSEGLDEFGCDCPAAWGESQTHLDNAIVDYHDQWGKRWPKRSPHSYGYD